MTAAEETITIAVAVDAYEEAIGSTGTALNV